MSAIPTSVFKSNKSQAVRLPNAVSLPDSVKKVDIIAIGNTRIITTAGQSWDQWFDSPGVSHDLMLSREQPEDQKRDDL